MLLVLIIFFAFWKTMNRGLAHYVIAPAAVASHNVKHACVLAWVASRFAASSCALRFSHFAIVLLFSWTKFFTKAKSWCLFWCKSRAISYISISVYRLPLSVKQPSVLKKCLRSRSITVMVNEKTRMCSLCLENGKKTSLFDWLPILPFQKKKKKRHIALPWRQWHAARRGNGHTGRTLWWSRLAWWACFYGSGSSHPDLEIDNPSASGGCSSCV